MDLWERIRRDKPVTVLFFGYTHGPDVCPTVIADFASALRRLPPAKRDRVEFVFITTDHGSHVTGFDRADSARVAWTPGTPIGDVRRDLLYLLTIDDRTGS